MLKILIVLFLCTFLLILGGNHYDFKRGRITRKEYDRRIRLTIGLIFVGIAILLYLRKR